MAIITIDRTQSNIVQDGLKRLSDIGITATNDTSLSKNLLQIFSGEITNTWSLMNSLLRDNFLSTAGGEGLDKIGVLVQEFRGTPKRAVDLSTSNVNLTIDKNYGGSVSDLLTRYYTSADLIELYNQGLVDSSTNPTEIRLQEGLVLTSIDGSISYITVNPLVISNSNLTDYTPVIANGIGSQYNINQNTLKKHNIASRYPILNKIAIGLVFNNNFAINSGSDTETDENFRFRIANKVVAATAGNESSIRQAVLSVPGIVDTGIIPKSHGIGTLTLFPRSADPILSDGLINAVRQIVNTVTSVGTIIYVEPPTYLGVSLRLEIRFASGSDKNDLIARSRLAVIDYINNLVEGDEIIINEIIQRVLSIDEKIIDLMIPLFGFGFYDRVTGGLSDFQVLRLLNQKAEWNEKWYTNSNMLICCEAGSR